MRLLLLFLCVEWVPLLHWRQGLGYALLVVMAYLPKTWVLAQLPLNPLYAQFLEISQMALLAQIGFAAICTFFLGYSARDTGHPILDLLRRPKFIWLWVEPLIAFGFAVWCAWATVSLANPVALRVFGGPPLMVPEAYDYWWRSGGQWPFLVVLLVPFVSPFFLRRYNRLLFAATDQAFTEAAGTGGARAPRRPPAGATIAGSAIAFPKVTEAARQAAAPSLDEIGRRLR